ncbi:hypothetical protein M7775_04545 [Sporomusa sphaeroides DSM 2875]|jgi:hypothetical protein|uniref:hypothetical protein n=1 Tax=Sporomusa sphaeroides TaxID=47679 RepID=UPI00203068C3|nr:hypothetical protein [Sporomusa sphaeroides]MCM0757842.1 hypothetical protein [Sporomusa sphaeroides DSM 2875]
MKKNYTKLLRYTTVVVWLSLAAFASGCTNNLTPVEPQAPTPAPSQPQIPAPAPVPPVTLPIEQPQGKDVVVTYNYGDTGKVSLSSNNLVLKVGQKLILSPAPGVTKTTRFTSSGDNFWGDVMRQEGTVKQNGQAIFTAIKAGKGKLQIIPNSTEVERAVDLWVTVQ